MNIALIGNPNCGKTSLFNLLTHSNYKVGNWAGVTVEKKSGTVHLDNKTFTLIDLPGVYTLSNIQSNISIDEQIAASYIRAGEASLLINIIDASNIERNLYLTLQLLEMQVPMVVAVNMMDLAHKKGLKLDLDKLSAHLKVPVVPLECRNQKGIKHLKAVMLQQIDQLKFDFRLNYPISIQQALRHIQADIQLPSCSLSSDIVALRLLEGDGKLRNMLSPEERHKLEAIELQIETETEESADILIANTRYQFVHQLSQEILQHSNRLKNNGVNILMRLC